jgi:F0F1-type ATP synthase assembly protein I
MSDSASPNQQPNRQPDGPFEQPEEEPKPENPVLAAGKFAADTTSASVIAYLITGPALFGGLGILLDRWLGTGFLVVLGILGGMALSLYVIWLRYGTQ